MEIPQFVAGAREQIAQESNTLLVRMLIQQQQEMLDRQQQENTRRETRERERDGMLERLLAQRLEPATTAANPHLPRDIDYEARKRARRRVEDLERMSSSEDPEKYLETLEMLWREAEIPRREWKLSASTKLSSKLRECVGDLINDPHVGNDDFKHALLTAGGFDWKSEASILFGGKLVGGMRNLRVGELFSKLKRSITRTVADLTDAQVAQFMRSWIWLYLPPDGKRFLATKDLSTPGGLREACVEWAALQGGHLFPGREQCKSGSGWRGERMDSYKSDGSGMCQS